MPKVAMLLANPFKPDPRVLKEAESLAQLGYAISILCWDRRNELTPNEELSPRIEIIRIHSVPSSYGIGPRQISRLPLFWKALYPLLNQINPDIIHCHDFDTIPAGILWGKLHHKPVIYDAHEYYAELCRPRLSGTTGNFLYHIVRYLELWGASRSSVVITVDERLASLYQVHNSNVVVIGHYPSQVFASIPNPVFKSPQLTLLYAGRISEDRGISQYLNLLMKLMERGLPVKLKLLGDFVPAEEKDLFQLRSKGLEDRIEYIGWVPYNKIPVQLRSGDVGLAILNPLARYRVAVPVKLFEYMAAGLPIIASDFPPVRRIIEYANCGLLVDPETELDLAVDAINEWWKNPSIAITLGENGRQAILNTYNWENLTEKLGNLYAALPNL